MTTKIKITHEGPDHHEVRVRATHTKSNGEHVPQSPYNLKPGESVELYVYDGQMVEVFEGNARQKASG